MFCPGTEGESIIELVVARAIRQRPEQAAAEMVKLIRSEAALQAELARLKAALRELGA